MSTKNNPGPFDCYSKAEPDEPYFVLLARDQAAPVAVREWVFRSQWQQPEKKLSDALAVANAMERWRHDNQSEGKP